MGRPHLPSSSFWFIPLLNGPTLQLILQSCSNLSKNRVKSSTDSCQSWQWPPFWLSYWKDTSTDVTPKLWNKALSMKLWTLEAKTSSINKKWVSKNNPLRGLWLSSYRPWKQPILMSKEEELKISWRPCMEVMMVSAVLMIQEPKSLSLRGQNMWCM